MHNADYLLIGGGLASATAAETLREQGATEPILIVSSEPSPPYERPPLSKRYLLGKATPQMLEVLSHDRCRQLAIDLQLETTVTSIDPLNHTVATDRGEHISYRKLLIATGGRARSLSVPGANLPGIYRLRTLADADALKSAAAKARQVVIVGGSFLGMEVAAALSEMGLNVTIIDQERALFPKLRTEKVSQFLLDMFVKRNVTVRLSEMVHAFEGEQHVDCVVTSAGARLPCDLVVLAVGVAPNVEFLEGSGIACDDGVRVDRQLQSSHPDIFAAGDVASVCDPLLGRHNRVEHWDSAVKQGRIAARNMLGQRRLYDELSYFYFDLFDLSFEVLEPSVTGTRQVVRGDLAQGSYAIFYLQDQIIRGLFSTGRPASETRAVQSLIRYRVNLKGDAARLAEPDFHLATIPHQTVLILQGGGAMGAFEFGVAKALEQNGIVPDIIAGVSIGAFNGAIIASNPGCATQALAAFWQELIVHSASLGGSPIDDALNSWQTIAMGSPNFFVPRWMQPVWSQEQLPYQWTSLYDTSPMKELISRYVDFPKLKNGPIRLLVSAVNVETAELEVFDSYVDDLTADHILASGSLPPSFPWTTINGKHYWDGGIVSNSPLDLVTERCGASGKRVFIVDLYPAARDLPKNLIEVAARRDEIIYSERVKRDAFGRNIALEYGRLVDELLEELDPARAEIMRQRPRFIELMGDIAPPEIVRIVRDVEDDDKVGRDHDFSETAVHRNRDSGFAAALKKLKTLAKP
ncbi:MAG: FAD-dependent oxidoreductase [Hyphomicrobiaceae bacterium]